MLVLVLEKEWGKLAKRESRKGLLNKIQHNPLVALRYYIVLLSPIYVVVFRVMKHIMKLLSLRRNLTLTLKC